MLSRIIRTRGPLGYRYYSVFSTDSSLSIRRHGQLWGNSVTRFVARFVLEIFPVKGTGEGEGKINKDWLRGSSISRKVNRWIGKGKKRKEKVRIAGAFR